MKRGFTLVELLVVISIIGFLSTVVFAAVNSARDKAEIAAVQLKVKQYKFALQMYYSDYGVYPNPTNGTGNQFQRYCLGHAPCYYNMFGDTTSVAESPQLMQALDPYIKGNPNVSTKVYKYIEPAVVGGDYYLGGALYNCSQGTGNPCGIATIIWFLPNKTVNDCLPARASDSFKIGNIVVCQDILK